MLRSVLEFFHQFELGKPICSRFLTSVLIRYVTLCSWPLSLWPWTFAAYHQLCTNVSNNPRGVIAISTCPIWLPFTSGFNRKL